MDADPQVFDLQPQETDDFYCRPRGESTIQENNEKSIQGIESLGAVNRSTPRPLPCRSTLWLWKLLWRHFGPDQRWRGRNLGRGDRSAWFSYKNIGRHCKKRRKSWTSRFLYHAVCSHGYGICSDVNRKHDGKVLFTDDERQALMGLSDASFKVSGFGSEVSVKIQG